jgi:hypothetical protein
MLVAVAVLVTLFSLRRYLGDIQAQDFPYEYWVAGWRVLHGETLYVWSVHQPDPARRPI